MAESGSDNQILQQSDLIAMLVHELRTPLASLNTASQLLMRPDLPEDQRIRITGLIRSEIERLNELTTTFLDLSWLESGRIQFQFESCEFGKLVKDSVEIIRPRAEERSLEVILRQSRRLPPITADRDKIKQVVINLLSNAMKYNQAGGWIRVHTSIEEEWLVFKVEDNGSGIPPDSLPHLFSRFYRAPGAEKLAYGTGLGLAICKHIVEAHGGQIALQSELEQGTVVTVRLPLAKPGATQPA